LAAADRANFPLQGELAMVVLAGRRQKAGARTDGTMTDTIKDPEQGDEDLLACEIADEALEAAAEKSKPAFTLIGSPTVSVLVACCG
jgi:hypothetical protein